MVLNSVIKLYHEEYTKNEYGVPVKVEAWREVFCKVNSVTASEFFEGGRNGLNPELRFTMFAGDYEGERTVGYNGQKYAIYRTFMTRNDTIELYAERQGGTNGDC